MPSTIVWCRKCFAGLAVPVGHAAVPGMCPYCYTAEPNWSTEGLKPLKAYNLSVMDYRFLRSVRIDPTK